MIFVPTPIPGVMEIRAAPAVDARGRFTRTYCREAFAAAGLEFQPTQISLSENPRRHTLRGMHWQAAPAEEQKLVRCVRGAVYDVALDLRAVSLTRGRAFGTTLSAESGHALLIPRGCAHGFLTLTEDALVEYMIDVSHVPGLGRGVRWNDPAFAIGWPAEPALMSERDGTWPDHG